MFFFVLAVAIIYMMATQPTTTRSQAKASPPSDQQPASVKQSGSAMSNMGTDSGYGSEEDEGTTKVSLQVPNHHDAGKFDQDDRIPVTPLQISLFFNMLLLTCIISPALLIPLLAVFAAAIFLAFPNFHGFRLIETPIAASSHAEVAYVPCDKHVARSVAKKDDAVDRTLLKQTVPPVTNNKGGPLHGQAEVKKDDVLQWLAELSTLEAGDFTEHKPRGYVHRKVKPIRDNVVIEFGRPIHSIPTFGSLVQELVGDWYANRKYPQLPAALPGSRAASDPDYDRGMHVESELAFPNPLGVTTRWEETSTRHVYIDVCIPGRWAIFDGTAYYVLRWLQEEQIWFCADWGFGFCFEDDKKLHIVRGLNPRDEEHMRGPRLWKAEQGPQGPFYMEAMQALDEELDRLDQQDRAAERMRWELAEQDRRDAWEVQRAAIAEMAKLRVELEMAKQREAEEKARQQEDDEPLQSQEEVRARPKATARPRRRQPAKTLHDHREENKLKAEQQMGEWEKAKFEKEKPEFGKKLW
ncbi:hypothetical protein N0V83_010472 [Neocucurbitaria cava]|uniref:Uncharacterized protein n=1 Tax=Neocucurbitaria cava TaxID=798079 RepID=A0A9W8Y0Q2_9PLEO|nr:hypothetical protein N0V83_010472 [Neocucurbitaria cava]